MTSLCQEAYVLYFVRPMGKKALFVPLLLSSSPKKTHPICKHTSALDQALDVGVLKDVSHYTSHSSFLLSILNEDEFFRLLLTPCGMRNHASQ